MLKCACSLYVKPICNLCERETFVENKNFMAGGALKITALFIAAGMEVSQTTAIKVIVYKSCRAWFRLHSGVERESECAEVCL